ncbi:MAG TPA: MFS transporter [Anaerolineaceae bacterium]|nr:MFS transporter [Anaerolineaceae bacterium]
MNRDLILIGVSLFTWGIGEGMFYIFMPIYLQQWGASPVQIGAIIGSVGIAMAFVQAPAGYLTDRIGPRKIMILSWVMGFIAAILMASAVSLEMFAAGMVVYYLSSFAMPAMNKYNTAVRGKLSIERALTITSVFFNFGAIVGPLFGGFLGERYGLQMNFRIGAGFLLASTIIVLFIRPHTASLAAPENDSHHSESLLQNKRYLVFLVFMFLTMFATYLPQPLTPNFLQNERRLNLDQIGQLGSIGSLSNALIMLFLGGMKAPVGLILGQALVGLYAVFLWRGTGMIWMGLAYGALGGYRLMRAMIVARARSLVRIAQSGLAFGVLETVNSIAVILAPLAAGLLYDRDPLMVYMISAGLIFVSILLNLLLLPSAPAATAPTLAQIDSFPDGVPHGPRD